MLIEKHVCQTESNREVEARSSLQVGSAEVRDSETMPTACVRQSRRVLSVLEPIETQFALRMVGAAHPGVLDTQQIMQAH